MQAAVLTCGTCDTPVPVEAVNGPAPVPCAQCGAPIEAAAFPALFRERTAGHSGERILFDDESSCFYHAGKKAVVPCDVCGRFLCALCDIEFNNQHICPYCIEAGKTKGKMEQLENERMRYDRLALGLSLLPIVFFIPMIYFVIFTAPAAMFVTLRHWSTPLGPVRPIRWRFVVAFVLSVLQLTTVGLFVTMIVMEAMR
ncbi:MAG: hypothetical protein KJ060_07355 [Candidatus Hydrogenedentes bacterium]|nr:hypothetical protein [Candidatus Hydrogenedentota bacterium]